jgi:hypothetical protein
MCYGSMEVGGGHKAMGGTADDPGVKDAIAIILEWSGRIRLKG